MATTRHYDVVSWLIHPTEDDCDLEIRTNNGWVFTCTIDPADFRDSPKATAQYFKCLQALREDIDDPADDEFDVEEACEHLMEPFIPIVLNRAPAATPLPVLTPSGRPTLAQWLFPKRVMCKLNVIDDHQEAEVGQTRLYRPPTRELRSERLQDLEHFFRFYSPADIEICYDDPADILIKNGMRFMAPDSDGNLAPCFFKPFVGYDSSGNVPLELLTHEKIAGAQLPKHLRICTVNGLVRSDAGLVGMLFPLVDKKYTLGRGIAQLTAPALRQRWASQITEVVETLHQRGIVWGDVKAENVLIDRNDDAWVTDFGGGYTPGWVDEDKAGTKEGDLQGLAKILELLEI